MSAIRSITSALRKALEQFRLKRGAVLLIFLLLPSISSSLHAQDRIYPTVLYSGVNPLTIYSSDGVSKIEIATGDGWKPVVIGYATSFYKVMNTPIFSRCAKKVTFNIFVERIDFDFGIKLRVTDCDGSQKIYRLDLENTWNLFYEDFGTVTIDDRPCHTFSVVSATGGDFMVEKITIPSRQFTLEYPFRAPPIRILGSKTYRYTVCFKPLRVGQLKVPVYVHVRRGQPSGSYTTYIVADTAYVNVVPSSRPGRPEVIEQPTVRIPPPPPKPKPPRLPPGGPSEPPHPPAQALLASPEIPDSLISLSNIPMAEIAEATADSIPMPEMPEFYHDPTTFRTILSPSARSLGKGKGFIASYDVAGLLAGYGLTDRLTVLGGGTYLPLGEKSGYVVTGGGKYELYQTDMLRAAIGFQGTATGSRESDIITLAPYLTAGYGTIDYSINLTAGYTWRRHLPTSDTIPPFSRQAPLIGLAGDMRFAEHWKVAAEGFLIANSEVQPVAVTLRWFNNRLAIDGGVMVDITPDEQILILPLLSGVWTW